MKVFARILLGVILSLGIPRDMYAYTSKVVLWDVQRVHMDHERLVIVLEFSESTYKKDLGDLLLAGRGKKISARQAYAIVSVDSTGINVAKQSSEYLFQDKSVRSYRAGFDCFRSNAMFYDLCEERILWAEGGRVCYEPVGDRVFAVHYRSARGGLLFQKDEGIWTYDTDQAKWVKLGIQPVSAEWLQKRKGEVFVSEDAALAFVWGSEGTNANVLAVYELVTGKQLRKFNRSTSEVFLGLSKKQNQLRVVFGHASGIVEMISMETASRESFQVPADLNVGPFATSWCVFDNDGGIFFLDLLDIQKDKARLFVWKRSAGGIASSWKIPLKLDPPSHNVLTIAAE